MSFLKTDTGHLRFCLYWCKYFISQLSPLDGTAGSLTRSCRNVLKRACSSKDSQLNAYLVSVLSSFSSCIFWEAIMYWCVLYVTPLQRLLYWKSVLCLFFLIYRLFLCHKYCIRKKKEKRKKKNKETNYRP